jgi:hypothetical protein
MEECRQDDERGVDRRQIVSEPPWEVDVSDRAAFSPKGAGKLSEGTAESVRREDQALTADHRRRHRCTPVGALRESRIQHVDHARLDREPGQGVEGLDSHERCPWAPWLLLATRSTCLCQPRTPRGYPVGRLLRVCHDPPLTPADSGAGTWARISPALSRMCFWTAEPTSAASMRAAMCPPTWKLNRRAPGIVEEKNSAFR